MDRPGRAPAILLALALASGCSRTYQVRPSHLARARQTRQEDVAIAAIDRDGQATWLRVDAIDYVDPPDPSTGLQKVELVDTRPVLRISGWVVGGLGLVALLSQTERGGSELSFPVGLILTGGGVFLLVAGYLFFDPESDGPTRGLPATVREP